MEAVKFTPGSSAYPFIFSEQCESSNGGCRKNKTNKKNYKNRHGFQVNNLATMPSLDKLLGCQEFGKTSGPG